MAVTLPATPLASQADLDALAVRVKKLEDAGPGPGPGPGPTPGQPSKTGTYITKPGDTPILDDALNAWSLVASGNQQIAVQRAGTAPPPMVDTVTQNVVKLGIDLVNTKRTIVQQNQAGNWYATAAPLSAWTQIQGPDGYQPPPVPAGSVFKVSGGNIHKPDGSLFKGTGVDIWWAAMSNRDGGWNQANQVIADWNTGYPLLQAFPNLSALRVACFRDGGGLGGFPTVAELKQLTDFCAAKRIVLILDAHDYSGGSNWVYNWADGSLQAAVDFFKAHAAAQKNNPWFWFQTGNEPGTPNEDQFNALYDAVRNQGNETIVALDWVTWGYTDRTVHDIAQRMHNVIIDLHYYAMAVNSSQVLQDHLNWIQSTCASINAAFKSADGEIPIACLEFGDACCGSVEPGGLVACQAVPQSAFKMWTQWNWCTDWNRSWGVDVINLGGQSTRGGDITKPYMIKA